MPTLLQLTCGAVTALFAGLGCAAAADQSQTFEVASVKVAAPIGMGPIRVGVQGGPGTSDPGQISYMTLPLKTLLADGFDLKEYQVAGPPWIDSERFDITAKIARGASKDDVRIMLRNLLVERFHLTMHRETKVLPSYALTVAKGGPKFKESPPEDAQAGINLPAGPGADRPIIVPGGGGRFPAPGQGTRMRVMNGRLRLDAKRQTIAGLIDMLQPQADKPLVDATGLMGVYDFQIEFTADASMLRGPMGVPLHAPLAGDGADRPAEEAAPDIFSAIQQQLGLKLEQRKAPVELLVIDQLSRIPIGN